MPKHEKPHLETLTLDRLRIRDARSFRHVGLYASLERVLIDARYPFRVLPETHEGRWDRALFLNLTFWNAENGADVLVDRTIDADVVTHVAWHFLASRALRSGSGRPSAAEAFLGESIASAFDLYLVGRLVGHSPDSNFLATQVPAMADAALEAGVSEADFEAAIESVAADPERAFEDYRAMLFDVTTACFSCRDAEQAHAVLAGFDDHRFGFLLHHVELSNWLLHARAHSAPVAESIASHELATRIDRTLREQPVSLDWLEREWLGDAAKPGSGAGRPP